MGLLNFYIIFRRLKMKTMVNKRRFLAALSAAMLISAALVTSCMSPLDEHQNKYQDKQEDSTHPPAGKGLVRIRVIDTEIRSILPTLPSVASLYFSVQFTGAEAGNVNDKIVPPSGASSYADLNNVPIVLAEDDYTILITAYDDDPDEGGNPVAGWSGEATVEDGKSTAITANLHGFTSSGKGTFTYTVVVPALPTSGTSWTVTTPPTDYDTITMEILDDNDVPVTDDFNGDPIDLTLDIGPNTNSILLPSGYYTVKITLTADNCQDRTATYAMHIYDTMTSTLSSYTIPPINQNKFSVYFNTNGYPNDDGGTFSSTTQTQKNIAFLGTVASPGTLLNTTHDFGGWFPAGGGDGTVSGVEWILGDTKVLKDTTLYAYWTAKTPTDTVINLTAIGGVTPPVTGATPKTTITPTAQYTGSIAWSPTPTTTFVGGTVYTATITLTPEPGYTLTGVTADFFTVDGATPVNNAANSGTITAVFPATDTTINIAPIGGVTPPVTGATPATTITPTSQYTGTISWSPTPTTTFDGGTIYTATITLTPLSGYTLTDVAVNFFQVTGAGMVSNAANSGTIQAVFPATATTITTATIGGVTPPVTGVAPVTTITPTSQYTGTISWSPTPTTTFDGGTIYTATITLTPASGYTLAGVGANFFTVDGTSTAATNAANSGTIQAVFPATDTTINITAIPVAVPVTGVMPQTTVNTGQYTGNIVWSPGVSGTFAAGTPYTATITLSPKTGYTLAGVSSFTVAGASPVTYTPGSNTVTAAFPATGAATTGITITFTINDISISGGLTSVTYSDLVSGTTSLVFTLNNASYTNVIWKLGNTVATGGSNTGITIDKDSNLLPFLVSGTHRLEAFANDEHLSAYVQFTVQ
jgi:hypothetical protein